MTTRNSTGWWSELRVRLGGLPMVAVPLIALCALTLFMRLFFAERKSADYELYQTIQVHSKVENFQAQLLEAQRVQRGYLLLMGSDQTLGPYKKVIESLPESLRALERQFPSDFTQKQRARRLEPMIERQLEILAESRQYGTFPDPTFSAVPESLLAEADQTGGEIRGVLNEILQAQDQRMQQAHANAEQTQHRGDAILLSVLAFGFLGGLGAVWMLMSRLITTERQRAEKTVQDSQAQLQTMLERAETQAQELARSEQSHRYQTQVLQSIVHSMGDGLVVLGSDGKIVVCNGAASQILEDLPNTPVSEWVSRYELLLGDAQTPCATSELPLTKALRGEEVERAVVFANRARNGSSAWVSMTARPMRDDTGTLKAGVLVLSDITKQKQNEDMLKHAKEEAERANRAKSDYLSRMSHELRTPLNAILGFAQLLEMAHLKAKSQENVGQILKAGRHLLSLINEVLDISRIEAGRLSVSLEPVLLPRVLEETMAMVATQAGARQIRLVDQPANAAFYVCADHQRLKQVFLNLLSNAVKYNRTGGTVTVSTEATGSGQIRIRISDTGDGIPPEKISLLFQPFERLGAEHTEVEGTGIGLALTKRLVELMAGTIGIESQPGSGSTFWVEFPAAEPPAAGLEFSQQLAAASQALQEAPLPTVLCIEDNPSNLRLVEQIFASRPGIRLISALQGSEGLSLARQQRPQLILLDVHLPDLDGREVLERLKADSTTASIPVMVVSADATARQEQRMREAGACGYLTKPLDVPQLLKAVEELLQYDAIL